MKGSWVDTRTRPEITHLFLSVYCQLLLSRGMRNKSPISNTFPHHSLLPGIGPVGHMGSFQRLLPEAMPVAPSCYSLATRTLCRISSS